MKAALNSFGVPATELPPQHKRRATCFERVLESSSTDSKEDEDDDGQSIVHQRSQTLSNEMQQEREVSSQPQLPQRCRPYEYSDLIGKARQFQRPYSAQILQKEQSQKLQLQLEHKQKQLQQQLQQQPQQVASRSSFADFEIQQDLLEIAETSLSRDYFGVWNATDNQIPSSSTKHSASNNAGYHSNNNRQQRRSSKRSMPLVTQVPGGDDQQNKSRRQSFRFNCIPLELLCADAAANKNTVRESGSTTGHRLNFTPSQGQRLHREEFKRMEKQVKSIQEQQYNKYVQLNKHQLSDQSAQPQQSELTNSIYMQSDAKSIKIKDGMTEKSKRPSSTNSAKSTEPNMRLLLSAGGHCKGAALATAGDESEQIRGSVLQDHVSTIPIRKFPKHSHHLHVRRSSSGMSGGGGGGTTSVMNNATNNNNNKNNRRLSTLVEMNASEVTRHRCNTINWDDQFDDPRDSYMPMKLKLVGQRHRSQSKPTESAVAAAAAATAISGSLLEKHNCPRIPFKQTHWVQKQFGDESISQTASKEDFNLKTLSRLTKVSLVLGQTEPMIQTNKQSNACRIQPLLRVATHGSTGMDVRKSRIDDSADSRLKKAGVAVQENQFETEPIIVVAADVQEGQLDAVVTETEKTVDQRFDVSKRLASLRYMEDFDIHEVNSNDCYQRQQQEKEGDSEQVVQEDQVMTAISPSIARPLREIRSNNGGTNEISVMSIVGGGGRGYHMKDKKNLVRIRCQSEQENAVSIGMHRNSFSDVSSFMLTLDKQLSRTDDMPIKPALAVKQYAKKKAPMGAQSAAICGIKVLMKNERSSSNYNKGIWVQGGHSTSSNNSRSSMGVPNVMCKRII